MRKEVSLDKATRLINHGPVILVSSLCGERLDITPVAWHMPVSKKPPIIVLEIDEGHFIYECIMNTGDFAVNIPSFALLEKVVAIGSCSGRDVDKFKEMGFLREDSRKIRSPRIKEAMAVMECVLIKDDYLLDKYNMVMGEVKHAEASEDAFDDHWLIRDDGTRTVHHLGDRIFCVPDGRVMDLRKKENM